MRSWPLLALPLALVLGCSARSAQPGGVQAYPAAMPSPLVSAVPFSRCQPPAAQDVPPIKGVQWRPGTAVAKKLGCQLSFRTSPQSGSLEISFEASSTPGADVRDRLQDLLGVAHHPGVVPLSDLGAGLVAGGVAYTGGSGVRYLLHASTAKSVVTVVCAVPTAGGHLSDGPVELQQVARDLLRWVLAHQPAEG